MNTDSDFDLLLAYLGDELGDDEVAALVKRLQVEPELAEQLVLAASEEGKIVEWAGATCGLTPLDDRAVRSSFWRPAWQVALAVAAMAATIGVTLWMAGDDPRSKTPTPGVEGPAPIARLVKADGCKWADGQAAMAEDCELEIGSVLELLDGVASIEYADGVRVSLEGPAKFEVTSSGTGTLHTGQLSATVPKEAIGFTIHTPALMVVDLGTQFGVRVDDATQTEVHVFQGEVETQTQGAPSVPKESQLLTTTQAARFNSDGRLVDWIEPDYDGFAGVERHAPGVLSTSRAVRWLPRPPASLEAGKMQSNSSVFLLLERRGVVPQRDLEITSVQRKGTQAHFSTEWNTLPAGTRVDSYLLHFDPSLSPQSGSGEIRFERPILGIIARGDQLTASDDLLGIPGIKYERSDVLCRGLDDGTEDHPPDVLNYLHSADRLKVTFGVQTGTLDQMRILVESGNRPAL